jgi:hypothetical protein
VITKIIAYVLISPALLYAAAEALNIDVLMPKPVNVATAMLSYELSQTFSSRNPLALKSPVGLCYVAVKNNGINSLQEDPNTRSRARKWHSSIHRAVLEDVYTQKLMRKIQKVTKGDAKEGAHFGAEAKGECIQLLAHYGHMYRLCLGQLIKAKIPNLRLPATATVAMTIKDNVAVELTAEQKALLHAAQLCSVYSLQEQNLLDAASFDYLFEAFLSVPSDSAVEETSDASLSRCFCLLQ